MRAGKEYNDYCEREEGGAVHKGSAPQLDGGWRSSWRSHARAVASQGLSFLLNIHPIKATHLDPVLSARKGEFLTDY